MDFYIFRHGETFVSKNGLTYGSSEDTAEILPEAIPVIEKLGKYLKTKKIDACFTSPYLRCMETVEIITKFTKQKFSLDERLSEFRGETVAKMVDRLDSFLKEIAKKKYKSVAICTHGYPIAVLEELIMQGKENFNYESLFTYPVPGVLVMIKNGVKSEIDFNKDLKEERK